jgi:hypothetical protein
MKDTGIESRLKYYNKSIDIVEIKANLASQLAIERMKTTEHLEQPEERRALESWIEAVRTQVKSLRFGMVQIVVHDARVVQIEKTEKIRFEKIEH